jgi:hypothetical protein
MALLSLVKPHPQRAPGRIPSPTGVCCRVCLRNEAVESWSCSSCWSELLFRGVPLAWLDADECGRGRMYARSDGVVEWVVE